MISANEIDQLLQKLQSETPNCGGAYSFRKINLEDYSGNEPDNIKRYLLRFENSDQSTDFALEKVTDFEDHLKEKLHYWSNHQTSLDCQDDVTEIYASLEIEFEERIHSFLKQEKLVDASVVIEKNGARGFGEDHVNDDTLIQTADALYVLHFGWSS